jgi:hypothetical protein
MVLVSNIHININKIKSIRENRTDGTNIADLKTINHVQKRL